MRKFYMMLTFLCVVSLSAIAQDGVKFNAKIDVDFQNVDSIQVPASPIQTQVLFVGGYDQAASVTEADTIAIGTAKSNNDFIGITPGENEGEFYISVNQERTEADSIMGDGGGMTVFKIKRDETTGELVIVDQNLDDGRQGSFFNVDFENTVGETWNNCGGIITPDGRIWTAEEYPASNNSSVFNAFNGDTSDVIIGTGILSEEINPVAEPLFEGELLKRYQNVGWMVEVDPKTAKAVRKQYNWGRMSFEGGAMLDDNKTVLLTEDGTPGILVKFIADQPGDFTKGTTYVYSETADGEDGSWVKMDNHDLSEMLNIADRAYAKGATAFIRLEWAVEAGGKIYIAETGLDNPEGLLNAVEKGGNIAPHHAARATAQGGSLEAGSFNYHDYYGRILVWDPATDKVTVHLEGGPEYNTSESQPVASYPEKHLSNPDGLGKLYVNGKEYLVIQEDLNGSSYNRNPAEAASRICEAYLLDIAVENPDIDDLVRFYAGPHGAELTGGNGTPDGKSILIDIQHPASETAPYTSENGVTTALNGFDKLASITDAAITTDFINTQTPQYSENLSHQVLFVGGTDVATTFDSEGNPTTSTTKENNDFIGIAPDEDGYWVVVNAEMQTPDALIGDGGGMTSFKITRKENDDFTVENIIDEESIVDAVTPVAEPLFEGELLKRYQNVGWMVEVDPKTAKAVRKQYNWGRMSFEGGAMLDDNKTVLLTEDGTPGILVKFIADQPGDFTKGTTYVYSETADGEDGSWVKMDNHDLSEMLNIADRAYAKGATAFIRLEWAVEAGGKIYIAETGLDNPEGLLNAVEKGGNIAPHHAARATAQGGSLEAGSFNYHDYYGRILVWDPATDKVTVHLEGGPEYNTSESQPVASYPEKHLSNPDGLGKLYVNGKEYLVIQEDLNGSSYNRNPAEAASRICEAYLLDIAVENPDIDDLVRFYAGPHGAELTGGNGTPDGKSILIDIQHPASETAPYTSENGVTTALNGFDKLASITDAAITTDFINTQTPQYSENLSHQVLFVGGTDVATTFDSEGNPTTSTTKENNDFIGIAPDEDGYWVVVNAEMQTPDALIGDGGGMTSFKVVRVENDSLKVVETTTDDGRTGMYHNMDFEGTVGETWNNCGGIISPDGRIWTAEEYPPSSNESFDHINNADTLDFIIGVGTIADGAQAGKYFNIDFENTVGETWNNCGGIISPDGRIWTAEEYPPSSNGSFDHINNADTLDFMIGAGYIGNYYEAEPLAQFDGERIERYQNIGWMVEIDPKNAKAVRKQYNWGRMSFEGGVIMPDNKTVYLTEDGTPGLFTKFVADTEGDFTTGSLYTYGQETTGENGHWIEMDNDNLDEMLHLADSAYPRGATAFIRLEWITEIDGKVYICETGLDKPTGLKDALIAGGNVADHHYTRAAGQGTVITDADVTYYDYYGRILCYDPETDEVTVFLEGGPEYATKESQSVVDYPETHLSNPDGLGKITVNGKNYMLICEDLNGSTYNRVPAEAPSRICELYMLDMTITEPAIDDLVRIMVGPNGAELTGANGTPDGKTILVDIQHPAETNIFPFNYSTTVALSGWNETRTAITDYFRDKENLFTIYPNPTAKDLYFNDIYDVAIYDSKGNLIRTRYNTSYINVSDLKNGIYFIKNENGETKKLIVR